MEFGVVSQSLPLFEVSLGSTVQCISRHIGYAWHSEDQIGKLRNKLEALKDAKRRVKHRVMEARRRGDKIEPDVAVWLKNTKDCIKKAETFLQDEDAATKMCFLNLSPDFTTRYHLSKKAKKHRSLVEELETKYRNFIMESVSYRDAPKSIGPVKGYEAFESRMSTVKKIKEALQDPDVTKIGVYGINGVGKTTLVREISRQVKDENLFDEVVMATVFEDQSMKEMQGKSSLTQTPYLRRIQGEIADGLDFQFHMETERGRADELRERLKGANKTLVVLDNIWAGIQLEDVGIPSDHEGLKILMTSTNQNVLFFDMGSGNNFQLDVLPHTEARNWFNKLVGDIVDNSALQEVAIQVADRCAGLPIVLVTVAKGLKDNEDLEAWTDALKQLSSFENEEVHACADSALQLSYKLLRSKEIKLLLLLCAQLPHYKIDVKDLLKYSVGLGLIKQSNTIEEARNRLLRLVKDLKASCFLQEGNKHGRLKMHDIVHSFAASVASRDHHVFIQANNTELGQWPTNDWFSRCTAVSLPYCKIPELPEVFECPKLKSFMLLSKDPLLKIPDNFFSKTKELRVLDLTKLHFQTLPSSFADLENLRTLCLKSCVLTDIQMITRLKRLQILSLSGSDIGQLPREIRKLTNLQLLDLSNMPTLEVIPPNVLSCLTQLEELCMENTFINWEGEEQNRQRNNANLAELKLLTRLKTLEIHIADANILPKGLSSEKLQSYMILIGDEWDWSSEYKTSRTLKLKLNMSNQLEKWIKLLLKRTEELYLDKMDSAQNSLYELDGQGFPQLKHLHVQNSHGIQYVIKSRGIVCSAFTKLESLFLDNLNNLVKIFYGHPVAESFCNLKILKVASCDKLKNLFSFCMARSLSHLEEISITDCKIMEEIIVEEDEDISDGAGATKLPHLRTLTLESLPQLRSFCSKVKAPSTSPKRSEETISEDEPNTTMPLFTEKVVFPNLKVLNLFSLNVEKIWDDQHLDILLCFENLTSLTIDGCGNLQYLLSSSTMDILVDLQILHICDCKMMKEIIFMGRIEEQMMNEMLLKQLNYLKLKDLPELTKFSVSNLCECPVLKFLSIENCPQLQTFISNPVWADMTTTSEVDSALFDRKVSFPNLECLVIFQMNRLRRIWHNELYEESFSKLKRLDVGYAEELQHVFSPTYMLSRFQNLEILFLVACNSLEEVFDLQGLMNVRQTRAMLATKLRTLHIKHLPNLKHIWNGDTGGILSFQNLDIVTVVECPNIKSLFPLSIARGLQRLTRLEINACGIEELVSDEEGNEARAEFEFPQLTYLKLGGLPKFTRFCPGTYNSEMPKLKYLDVYDCDKVELFTSEQENFQDACSEGPQDVVLQQPLFSAEKVIPNLEELPLNSKDATMIWRNRRQFSADLFCNVKFLHLQCFQNESTAFPFGLIGRFKNLEKLLVANSCFKEMFAPGLGSEENQYRSLLQIRHLKLDSLYNLKWIKLDHVLKSVETLEVWRCNMLVNLAPSSASFKNLLTLEVHHCKGLVYLMTFSTAQSLVQLTKLNVRDCTLLREVVITEGDEGTDEIVFPKLESLRFNYLINLTTFCLANCTVKFPLLEEVIVRQCPKMSIFSHGVLFAPKLQGVQTERRDDKYWQGDLNSTIKQLYAELAGFNGMRHLKLSEFPELRNRWPDQLPASLFNNLNSLVVDWCSFYWCALPYNLLPSLNVLEELEITKCDSVEEVFDVEHINVGSGPVGHLSKLSKFYLIDLPSLRHVWDEVSGGLYNFRNLTVLKIQSCGNLRYVFTASVVMGGLVQLKEMEVKFCPMIREIISKGVSREAMTYIFPLLNSIYLDSLPNLTSLCSGSGTVECPSLKKITVISCPTRFTYSFMREQEPHTIGEAPQLKIAMPNLEKLRVEWNDTLEEFWHEEFQVEFFCNLKVFELIRFPDDYVAFPLHFLQRLPRLEKLVVSDASFEEILLHEGTDLDEEHTIGYLQQLRELKLSKLPNLKLLLRECSRSYLLLQNLETLKVSECDSLNMLVPSSISFQFLKILEVSKCHGLINLITSSTAKSLLQLATVSITECEMLQEIVASGEDEVEDEIIFSKLKYLQLHSLPSIMDFYSGTCALIFPSLEELQVKECPVMKYFSLGDVSMPQLKKLDKDKGWWEGNLNAPMQQLFREMGQCVRTPSSGGPRSSKTKRVSFKGKNIESIVPAIIQLPSRRQDLQATSSDKEEAAENQARSAASIWQRRIHHSSLSCAEQSPLLTSASPVQTSSFTNQTHRIESIPTLGTSSIQGSERTVHPHSNLGSLLTSVEALLKLGPTSSSSQSTSSSSTHVEANESNHQSSETYGFSIELVKEILKKNLTEVARSTDAFILLFNLKKLKNCPLLNPQQREIIQAYIENFDSLVTYHPLYEQHISTSSALEFCIEDDKKGMAELKSLYEDCLSKTYTRSSEKEALKRRLSEIEEEENHARTTIETLHANLVTRKAKLEKNMNAFMEAVRHRNEAEEKSSIASDHWCKLKNLFA